MRYCFDLDGTICETPLDKDYTKSTPIHKAVVHIQRLKGHGHYIIIDTARGASSGIDWYDYTKECLDNWGVPFDELRVGKKPNADIFIDDKAISSDRYFESIRTSGIVAGMFDILHPGYIQMFKDCKEHCDTLTVALHINPHDDRPEKREPIFSAKERASALISLEAVDSVVFYTTEEELQRKIRNHDIRFLGEEYQNQPYTRVDEVPIHWIDRSHGWSYTKVIKKIRGEEE